VETTDIIGPIVRGQTLQIQIKRGPSGMYFATSDDEPTFFLAQRTWKALMAALPVAGDFKLRRVVLVDIRPDGSGPGAEVHDLA
jgi:hypothetical protein